MKTFQFIKKNILWIIIIGLLLFLLLKTVINQKQENRRHLTNLETLKLDLKVSRLKNGDLLSEKQSLLVTQKELVKGIYVKDSIIKEMAGRLKKVKSAVIVKTEFKVDTIEVPYEVPVPYEFDKPFSFFDHYFTLTGRSNQDGLYDVDLYAPINLRLVHGVSGNFFKTKVKTIATSDNPNVIITDIISQDVVVKKKRWVIGPSVGVNLNLEPTFGASLVYGFIRF